MGIRWKAWGTATEREGFLKHPGIYWDIYIVQTFVYQGHVLEEVQTYANRVVAVGYSDTASVRKSKNVHMS